ncbi:MAG: hypothetical protein AB7S26_23310 [Sandaracinaceae bacterium]
MPHNVLVMIAVVVVSGGALLLVLSLVVSRARRRLDADWDAFATERGLRFTPAARASGSRTVEGTVRGVPFVIDRIYERVGRGPAPVIRVRATIERAGVPELAAWLADASMVPREPPRGPSLFAGGPTEGPTVRLGDPDFDTAFRVVTEASAIDVAGALPRAARAELVAIARRAPVSLVVREGEVVVTWFGDTLNGPRTDRALEIVAMVASGREIAGE